VRQAADHSRDSIVRYARKNGGGEDIENKNVKARPISMPNRYGILLFASSVRCSPSFNFHYRSLFSDLICCPVRSTYISVGFIVRHGIIFFLPLDIPRTIEIGNADSFVRFVNVRRLFTSVP